jgi:hypothetical protein
MGKTTHFQSLVFPEKKLIPRIMAKKTKSQWSSGKTNSQNNGRNELLRRPNLNGVHRFDFKISYINYKKAWQICHLKVKVGPLPPGSEIF